jgi:hypothetical protein
MKKLFGFILIWIWVVLFFKFIFFMCSRPEPSKFEPNPTYKTYDTIYLKPDSAVGVIKWFSVIVGKDTIYYYGVEKKDSQKIISSDKEIFGKFTKVHN